MATRVWIGNVSSVGSDANNWSGGVAPSGGDSILADERAQSAMTTGNDFSATALVDVHFTSGYRFGLGAVATPMRVQCDEFLWEGSGDSYIAAKGGDITRLIVRHESGTATITGTSGTGVEYGKIEWIRGNGVLDQGSGVPIRVLYVVNANSVFDSNVKAIGVGAIDLIRQTSGTLWLAEAESVRDSVIHLADGVMLYEIEAFTGTPGSYNMQVNQGGGTFQIGPCRDFAAAAEYNLDGGVLHVTDTAVAGIMVIDVLNQCPGTSIINEEKITISAHNKIGVP